MSSSTGVSWVDTSGIIYKSEKVESLTSVPRMKEKGISKPIPPEMLKESFDSKLPDPFNVAIPENPIESGELCKKSAIG